MLSYNIVVITKRRPWATRMISGSSRHRYVNRVSTFLIVAALIAAIVGCDGNGPYPYSYYIKIYYCIYLDSIRDNLVAKYVLMNDLDSATPCYTEIAIQTAYWGCGCVPISYPFGDWHAAFNGTFDGQGYEIRDLFANHPEQDSIGLFARIDFGAVVKNLGMVDFTITGDRLVGGLVGWNNGTISNSYLTGSVTGGSGIFSTTFVGGLVGLNEGTVTNCYSTGSVTGADYVGGLVGQNRPEGIVSDSYATGSATGYLVGGLVGENEGTVSDSYSTGGVIGIFRVGGLVGFNNGLVTDSYSTGNVSGTVGMVGGLVGDNDGTVNDSYASGSVTGDEPVGGLVAANSGTVSNSYATGSVTGYSSVGGLVGYNNHLGTVSNSYATGSVTGDECVGGLVADNSGTVSDSYSTASVTGITYVGGLVGDNYHGVVSNSYSTGTVAGNWSVGGLVGLNSNGTVTDSFWDMETSGQATSIGGTGKSTAEMQNIATFSGAGWDITEVSFNETNPAYVWNIVDGLTYPFLSWQS